MPSPHPTSRSRAPISLTFVAASARETPRARVRGARGPGYDRLAVAFGQLPEALLVELAQGLQETFSPGETIVREGDPADRFYIIESGQVEGTQRPRQADVHVLRLQAGDYFGEVGLLSIRTRTATVRAVSEVRVVSLDRAQFQALIDPCSSTAAELVALLDHRTRAQRTRSGAQSRDSPIDPAADRRAAAKDDSGHG